MWLSGDLNGGEGKSLQVHLGGEHQGKWKDWAEPHLRGDLIDLWREVKGITAKQALREIREFLGISAPITDSGKKSYSRPKNELKPLTPEGKTMNWLVQERKLEPSVIALFDIKIHVRGHNGSSEGFVVFPCFSPDGEWLNSSYRGLKPDENGKKKVFQDKDCAPCLFGWQSLKDEDYRSRKILLCEGQIDAMTWRQWGISALSIPNGNGATWIDFEWDNLEVFDTIYLSFDMDGKTKDTLQKVISRLGNHRCLLVNLPEKDANDCLKKGHTSEDAKRWISQAKVPVIPNFVSMSELRDRLIGIFFPKPTDAKPLQLSLFNAKREDDRFLIRPGEVTVWTGISSHGKTTFLTFMFLEMASKDERNFICSLEMLPEQISAKMVTAVFGENPVSVPGIEDFITTLGESTCFSDVIGYISQEKLFSMMEFAYRRYGCTQFLIDSLMRIEGLEEDYPAQGIFLNRLCEFAKKFMVHVHLVVHPRKTADDSTPNANDLKGSSLLRNNADNIVIVKRNVEKERKIRDGDITEEEAAQEHDTVVYVDKDRTAGKVKLFKYKFLWKHNRFTLMETKPKNSAGGESSNAPSGSGKKFTSSYPPRKTRSR